MANRINQETGIFEEKVFDVCGIDVWVPTENSDGNVERVNSDTGVHEERVISIMGILDAWVEKD